MSTRTAKRWGLLGIVAPGLLLAATLLAGGCAEKIAGPGQDANVNVSLDLKAGPTVTFRLTVWAADMDTVTALMAPVGDRVAAALSIPAGPRRHFRAEALDAAGTVLYRGVVVRDVVDLLPLDLTIAMLPVAPMLYLNPHFAQIALGTAFTVTVNANDLPGLSGAGMGLSLFGFNGYKLAEIAVIDSVTLAPAQVERGSGFYYQDYGNGEVYFDVANEGPIVDEEGDGALVIIHCRTQDTWPGEPVDLVPTMFVEYLGGYQAPIDSVSLDTALYRLFRPRAPESYLGSPGNDVGVALVGLGGGEAMLAGNWNGGVEYLGQGYLARLGASPTPLAEAWLDLANFGQTTGLARAAGSGFFVSGAYGDYEGSVVRVDAAGRVVWQENLANYSGGQPYAVAARPGGGCIAAGAWSNDGLHFYLAAFGLPGYEQHHAPADFSRDQSYRAVVALDDSTFVAAGYERPFSGTSDAVLAKHTLEGKFATVWSRRYGTSGDEAATDLLALADGGFMMVGAADTLSSGLADLYVVRTDAAGRRVWSRHFGAPGANEVGLSLAATPDGAFVAAGYASEARQANDVYIVKFGGAGNLIWERRLGGPVDERAADIIPLGGGYLVTGTAAEGPNGLRDILVLRLGSDGKRLAD